MTTSLSWLEIFFDKSEKAKLVQVRSNKAEEEVAELMKKSTQLEVELDKTKEQLVMMMIMMMMIMMMRILMTMILMMMLLLVMMMLMVKKVLSM